MNIRELSKAENTLQFCQRENQRTIKLCLLIA
mgnify:CR=1 FL=1